MNKLDYTTAFIKETLRFAGPAPMCLPRSATEDHTLGGGRLKIKKGTVVSTYFHVNGFNP